MRKSEIREAESCYQIFHMDSTFAVYPLGDIAWWTTVMQCRRLRNLLRFTWSRCVSLVNYQNYASRGEHSSTVSCLTWRSLMASPTRGTLVGRRTGGLPNITHSGAHFLFICLIASCLNCFDEEVLSRWNWSHYGIIAHMEKTVPFFRTKESGRKDCQVLWFLFVTAFCWLLAWWSWNSYLVGFDFRNCRWPVSFFATFLPNFPLSINI